MIEPLVAQWHSQSDPTFGETNKRRALLEQALHDVCVNQGPVARRIVLCHWGWATSWGLQVAVAKVSARCAPNEPTGALLPDVSQR